MRDKAIQAYVAVQSRLVSGRSERGDLVGWLLIAVMTALLVAAVWGTLGGQLKTMISDAMRQAKNSRP